MVLPRGDEYNVAVQNPKIAFTDSDLKISSVEETLLGLPKPYSGVRLGKEGSPIQILLLCLHQVDLQ